MLGCSIGTSAAQPPSANSPIIATNARMIRDSPAHDPPKCMRFGDKIMRSFNSLERDRTQNRMPLLLIALCYRRLLHGNRG
jgi:hypothetical protein